jgi:hypothetical protein
MQSLSVEYMAAEGMMVDFCIFFVLEYMPFLADVVAVARTLLFY